MKLTRLETEVLACLTTGVPAYTCDIADDLVEKPRGTWTLEPSGALTPKAQVLLAIATLRTKIGRELGCAPRAMMLTVTDKTAKAGRRRGYMLTPEAFALAATLFELADPARSEMSKGHAHARAMRYIDVRTAIRKSLRRE